MSASADRPSQDVARQVLISAAESGVTLWDTADAYCLDDTEIGYCERLFAAARAVLPSDLRDQIIIATKGGTIRPGGRWEADGRPEYLRAAIDASLQALQTDCIELYQLHRVDPQVSFADSIGAMAEAREQGKIRHIGLSNVDAAQIDEAVSITPIASVQNQYNPMQRSAERDGVLDKCREHGLAFLPYSPLGGLGAAKDIGKEGALTEIAAELSVSPQRAVLAWMLGKYDKMIPIPGARRIESIKDSAAAADISLTPEQIARLDASFA
jgi:aryl-alcohol dehydrogenase-like predicted oxidoreductase